MAIATRSFVIAVCLALVTVVGCGESANAPVSPSGTGGGATISGTVNGAGASVPTGLTVSVTGTDLSAVVGNSGSFRIASVPSGNVQLQFKDATVNAAARISNVANDELIEIKVQVNGTVATIVDEVRSNGKVALCHRTESGTYQSIEVGASAEPAHRAHGDGKVGEPVPGEPTKIFDENCRPVGPSVEIRKSTNGEDADQPPGPSIRVGSPVTWTYRVTNTGTVNLTNVLVTDDRNVAVDCKGQTTLLATASITCTAAGTATLGQYKNVGTVTARWTMGAATGTVSDSDTSHYLGVSPTEEEGPKVQLCHRTGNGSYHLIEVSINAEPAHRAHGDGKVGEAVPGNPGKRFGSNCSVM